MAALAKTNPEIEKMRKGLVGWLRARAILAAAAAGQVQGANAAMAKRALARYTPTEVALGKELYRLLREVDSEVNLPEDPVELAKLALGNTSQEARVMSTGIWPLLIVVGGAILLISSIVNRLADKAEEERYLECVEAGACPPPTNWGKVVMFGALGVGLWFLWAKTNVFNRFKKA